LHFLALAFIEGCSMLPRRSLPLLAVVAFLAACASAPVQPAPQTAVITVDLASSPVRARDQLTAAFAAQGLPVSTSQPGVVEYRAPRERGVLGYYEVFARAVIEPADCGTRITMFGEETKYPNAVSSQGTPSRIGSSSKGRAAEVWSKMQRVAAALRDSTRATPATGLGR
jgi:hypothetical protein